MWPSSFLRECDERLGNDNKWDRTGDSDEETWGEEIVVPTGDGGVV